MSEAHLWNPYCAEASSSHPWHSTSVILATFVHSLHRSREVGFPSLEMAKVSVFLFNPHRGCASVYLWGQEVLGRSWHVFAWVLLP